MGLAVSLPPLSKVTGDEKLNIKEKRPGEEAEELWGDRRPKSVPGILSLGQH